MIQQNSNESSIITIRVPQMLKAALLAKSAEKGETLNSFCNQLLKEQTTEIQKVSAPQSKALGSVPQTTGSLFRANTPKKMFQPKNTSEALLLVGLAATVLLFDTISINK